MIGTIETTGKEKYMQHGSTFFNSGYVDYLDKNYDAPCDGKVSQQKNSSYEDDGELVGDDW